MKSLITLGILIFSVFLLAGCSSPTITNVQEQKESTENNIKSTTTVKVSQTAKYKIEFKAVWSSKTHPDYYPANAHFSPFVAYSHNNTSKAQMFTLGETPSPGVEEMAETGATGILIKEIQNIIDAKNAYTQTKGGRIDSPGQDSSELSFSQDYSYVTFVSMLAPSPDWFIANTTNLIQSGEWVEKIELQLVTYDAGGDDGKELTSEDQDSNPKQSITVFDQSLQNLGSIVLTKID